MILFKKCNSSSLNINKKNIKTKKNKLQKNWKPHKASRFFFFLMNGKSHISVLIFVESLFNYRKVIMLK